VISQRETLILRDSTSRKGRFTCLTTRKCLVYVTSHPGNVGFTWFGLPNAIVFRGFASRKRPFHVVSHTDSVRFTWFGLPKASVSRDSASRKRLFYVVLPPESACFTWFCRRTRARTKSPQNPENRRTRGQKVREIRRTGGHADKKSAKSG
jgi:hypothetical protein